LRINGLGGKLSRSEQGQALAEYAALLGLLLSMLFIMQIVGNQANHLFHRVLNAFQ
jgi:hypothetical protein